MNIEIMFVGRFLLSYQETVTQRVNGSHSCEELGHFNVSVGFIEPSEVCRAPTGTQVFIFEYDGSDLVQYSRIIKDLRSVHKGVRIIVWERVFGMRRKEVRRLKKFGADKVYSQPPSLEEIRSLVRKEIEKACCVEG